MSNNMITSILDDLTEVFNATDDALNDWKGDGNLQFPLLVQMMAVKMNWDEKQMREADPLIRYYVRKHPDWYVTRGAHGGIMKTADKLKKDSAKVAKASIKDQLKVQIDAKVAQSVTTTDSIDLADSEEVTESEE